LNSDHEIDRLLVPAEVVEELEQAGYIRSASNMLVKGGAGEIVLTVFNCTASSITLCQSPGVIGALARSLIHWFRKAPPEPPRFELTARGPNGSMQMSLDHEPDEETLVAFLRDNIWGTDAPPGIEPRGNVVDRPRRVRRSGRPSRSLLKVR
jgi:hypothetical protein